MKVIHISWCMMLTSVLVMGMESDIPDKKAEDQQVAVLTRICFPDSKQLTKHEREGVHIALAELYATDNVQLIRTLQQGKIQEQDKRRLQERVRRVINDVHADAAHFYREKREQERDQQITTYLTKLMVIALAALMITHSLWDYCSDILQGEG